MTSASSNERVPQRRRVPQQTRSRDRVERVLEATEELLVTTGVDRLSTRAIASAAEIPVATLYQYFADKEAILLALVERHIAEMDAQVAEDLTRLEVTSVRAMVTTTMRAFVKIYHRRPAFVALWFRGRTNAAINEFCRAHNKRIAAELFALARQDGLVVPDSTVLYAELAVEVADRVFQVAFEDTFEGDPHVIDEGIALVTAYLETHATPVGITGVPRTRT